MQLANRLERPRNRSRKLTAGSGDCSARYVPGRGRGAARPLKLASYVIPNAPPNRASLRGCHSTIR